MPKTPNKAIHRTNRMKSQMTMIRLAERKIKGTK